MRALHWLLRALLFFVLFAFALNNQHEVPLKWFFGFEWRAPMVFIVLAAFVAGCAVGILGMLPGWWQHRRRALQADKSTRPAAMAQRPGDAATPTEPMPLMPPRDGL